MYVLFDSPKEVWKEHAPSLSVLFLTFIAVSTLVVAITVIYRLYFHPLAGIPGPFLARCSTVWQNWGYWGGTWHKDILHVHEKYGPVVRINHYEVSFVDGDALKRVYGHVNPCKKVSRCIQQLTKDDVVQHVGNATWTRHFFGTRFR
jgi:hypothetical protein